MALSINYKELSAYISSITVMKDDFNEFLKKFLLEMAERIIVKLKQKGRTPVDTGALRNSWELGDVRGEGQNISVEILNGMEYATDVEYGHRIVVNGAEVGWYNGRFMLRISIDEIRRQIPARYQMEFKMFCTQHGIMI